MLPSQRPGLDDRPATKGQRTREEILQAAVRLGSVHGLEALSIGMLATELGMSKAGLVAHFGSKQALQLAAVETARELVRREIMDKAAAEPEGLPQFRAYVASYFDYLQRRVLPGGCFFTAIAVEFDDQEGPVRDLVHKYAAVRNQTLEDMLLRGQELGQIQDEVDTVQLAFETTALMQGAVVRHQLSKDPEVFARAIAGVNRMLDQAAVDPAINPESDDNA